MATGLAMNKDLAVSRSASPPLNPMDLFLDDLLQPAVDVCDTIHGKITECFLPNLTSPLRLLQDVGPGYSTSLHFSF